MSERNRILTPSGPLEILPIGLHVAPNGLTDFREFYLLSSNRSFILQVGTPQFIESLRAANAKIPDPNLRADETILPLSIENLQENDIVIQELTKIEPANLVPYLREA
jgi:hypothetical protein